MTDREYDLLLQMMNSLEQPLLTESEYRAAVARGAVAPCDSVMQLAFGLVFLFSRHIRFGELFAAKEVEAELEDEEREYRAEGTGSR